MPDEGTDMTACLERVRAGDNAAARDLVDALAPLVGKIVGAHLPWRLSADDLRQEIFMKVFARLDQYAGVVPFEHWVARVALNTCRDHQRGEQRSREVRWTDLGEQEAAVLESIAHETAAPDATEGIAARELAERLLATLSPDDRLVVTMLDLERRTAAEVRELTGWSITGIRVRAFRARRKLRKQMEQLQEGLRT